MSKVKFELDLNGLNELMKSPEMQNILDEAGKRTAEEAGEGYGSRGHVADFTAICNVFPETRKAAIDNQEHNTLLKSLGSVGLSYHK